MSDIRLTLPTHATPIQTRFGVAPTPVTPYCAPRAHHWQHAQTLLIGLPMIDGTARVLQLRTCTRCGAGVELGGQFVPATRRLRSYHSGLWLPPDGTYWLALVEEQRV